MSDLIVCVLSALGVVSVFICVFYFRLVFPVAVGTSVLGYQILFGLFLCFAINFSFLIPATVTICWIRRLGMSLSYTIIISGLLVKVLNTWRIMAIKSRSQQLNMSTPSDLLFISTGLVSLQLIITLIWLFISPPNPGFRDSMWTCSVSASSLPVFNSEIVVSVLDVVLLLIITIFFSALTWNCYDQNREPRWIMVCCAATVMIWSVWLFFAATVDRKYYYVSIVCANLLNSCFVMLVLYVRKLYLFAKISRRLRKERQLKSLHSLQAQQQHQIYGAFKSAPIIWHLTQNSAQQNAHSNTLRGATRPPFEADYGPEDNVSTCGSVKSNASAQVQAHDLYPMEVYEDGCSQFAPLSSLFAHSNKSVYGIIDDSNVTSFR